MSSVPVPAAPANVNRTPPAPVAVAGRLLTGRGQAMHDLFHGHAILEIESAGRLESYWTTLHISPDGHIAGVRLQRFATGDQYDLPADLDDCTCADRTYRPERPGGCRHMVALREALVAVAKDNPPPKRTHAAERRERDEATGPHTNPAA